MERTFHIEEYISHEKEGQYLTVPFEMPEDTETLIVSYRYTRYAGEDGESEHGIFSPRNQINIIDLGLIDPHGEQVGASGSDKSSFRISETEATPGYRACRLIPGKWQIILGAYKVAPEGVSISYEIECVPKHFRWLRGDLHTHTEASDGVLTLDELGQHALRHGLEFLVVTDHNQPISADRLPQIPGLTIIPGIEWTHYKGHANFTGVDAPFDGTFIANTPEEVEARFASARERGALITINHPFDEGSPFTFDMDSLPFDLLEIWNGPMRMSNIQAVGLWHSLLAAGKKIPACGGSDYHRSQPFLFLGGPTTCVYAASAGASDILDALRRGRAYIIYAPDGPVLELTAGGAVMGDSVFFSEVQEAQISVTKLQKGDELQVVTAQESVTLLKAESNGNFKGAYTMTAPGFIRVVISRAFIPGVPMLPALISNPIYFDAEK